MSLRAFRTLVAIAEHGSFAAAARAVNLSQSAVSTQMRGLEDELHVALFDRSTRPPALNEAGQALVGKARELIAAYEDIQSAVTSTGAVEGRIRLGAVGSTLTGVLPRVLTIIRERYPNLHIEIVSGFSEELLQQVGSRALDAAIVSDYDGGRRDLAWRPFLTEPLVMIAPPDAVEESPKKLHHGHGIAIVPERRFPGHALFAVKRIPFGGGRHHRTLGIVQPAESAKQRLIDVLFAELTDIVSHSSSHGKSAKRPHDP
jgi:molybdate transport repressor ModE-like protein